MTYYNKTDLLKVLEKKIPENAICQITYSLTEYTDNYSLPSVIGQSPIIAEYQERTSFMINCEYMVGDESK